MSVLFRLLLDWALDEHYRGPFLGAHYIAENDVRYLNPIDVFKVTMKLSDIFVELLS